jgi:CRP/FNR family nitrogen fixation transcriptional regulator
MHTDLATVGAQRTIAAVFPRPVPGRHPGDEPATHPGMARHCGKDEEIFAEGDAASHYFRVVSGVVRSCKILSDGRRQIDAFHVTGEMFGIERGDEHRFSAEAVGDVTVVSFRRCSLELLAESNRPLACQIVSTALINLERAQQHMILLGRKSAIERVASFLLDTADRVATDTIDLPMSRTDIADYLGLTIETVSRTLTQLERDLVIAVPAMRRSIVLRNKAALRRLSE